MALGKCSRIRHIVRLRQLLRRWRNKASAAGRFATVGAISGYIPSDVPSGHVAVCVGATSRRFVVRAAYLNHPAFRKLLTEAEEEYGFSNSGPLSIPCDESLFEEVIRVISRTDPIQARSVGVDGFKRCYHVGSARKVEGWTETRPFLHGLTEKSVW